MAPVWTALTPTVAATSHVAGDQVGGVMNITSVITNTGTSGVLVGAQAVFTTAITPQIDLLLFSADPDGSDAGDDGAISFSDSDMLLYRGPPVRLSRGEVTALNAYAGWSGYQVFELAATTLYIVAITRDTATFAANGVTFRLGIIPTI